MKRIFAAMLAILVMGFSNNSQAQGKALAAEAPLTYLGIDFTAVKVINDLSTTAEDIKARHFAGINQLFLSEPKKFDWGKALGMSNVTTDLALVTARNEQIEPKSIMSTNIADESHLKEADIAKMVSQYDFKGKTGTGLIVFWESMSKTSESGSMYVTFVDMGTKKVLLTERMAGKAGGFGFRNYYANSIYKVLQDVKKNKIAGWRTQI
ncbi:hypothetical protein [Flavihumibacter petaseus]|uniref:Uncharacterized protein n=1 Tax=Flavihumibacter petaseus NBRC 106054 TaxID=1220578 RepID=A0A0E9MXE4_9BACT|nr:hypothetical protein [Flavihumibacter petaseus]GAO42091.1 hypothetical protein FPE01S_01_11040 [Flavihumibacter petaseus NBRC 106054]